MKYIKTFSAFFLIFNLSSLLLLAQDSAGEEILLESPWLNLVITVIIAMAAIAAPFLRKISSKWLEEDAVEALAIGVSNSWRVIVRDAKAAADDNKLTVQEKNKALDNAFEVAKKEASGRVRRFLKKKGKEYASSVIERLVAKAKKK